MQTLYLNEAVSQADAALVPVKYIISEWKGVCIWDERVELGRHDNPENI